MKYYLIQIQNLIDGKTDPAIYIYDDIDTAEATFHSKLSSDIKAETVLSTIVKVLDNSGNVVFSEYWQKNNFAEVTDKAK